MLNAHLHLEPVAALQMPAGRHLTGQDLDVAPPIARMMIAPMDRQVPARRSSRKSNRRRKRPNLYRVLILNDDYTPMEFVVHVLEKFFNKDIEAATKIMLHVHHRRIGECGVFTYRFR